MALLHVVIGDKNIDEEGSVELEQTRARLVETQNELDRVRESLTQREDDCEKLRQVSSDLLPYFGWRVGRAPPPAFLWSLEPLLAVFLKVIWPVPPGASRGARPGGEVSRSGRVGH